MTYQISKEINTHVVLTYSGSKHFITSKQELALRGMNDNDRFYVNDKMVRVNTIKEIMSVEDFYKNNPKERPTYTNYTYSDYSSQISRILSPAKDKNRALKGMIKGLNKYIRENPPAEKAKELLKNMEQKLANN